MGLPLGPRDNLRGLIAGGASLRQVEDQPFIEPTGLHAHRDAAAGRTIGHPFRGFRRWPAGEGERDGRLNVGPGAPVWRGIGDP